ncbi:hypothetical protein A2U01_0065217, partial [Trifolium medium]|nr:hypothetical protein [Trifolium medium]
TTPSIATTYNRKSQPATSIMIK